MNPLLLTDFYKVHHNKMYPEGTTMIYSNFTPRKSRMGGVDHIIFFGLQHFMKKYLVEQFNEHFFEVPFEVIQEEYSRQIPVGTAKRVIFKDPATDNSNKKSARGLLRVDLERRELVLHQDVSWEEEKGQNLLQQVFLDGKITYETNLGAIRGLIDFHLNGGTV